MPDAINLEDILQRNPAINPDDLRASIELQESLRQRGFVRKGYDLVPPSSGKRVQVVEVEDSLVNLNSE